MVAIELKKNRLISYEGRAARTFCRMRVKTVKNDFILFLNWVIIRAEMLFMTVGRL